MLTPISNISYEVNQLVPDNDSLTQQSWLVFGVIASISIAKIKIKLFLLSCQQSRHNKHISLKGSNIFNSGRVSITLTSLLKSWLTTLSVLKLFLVLRAFLRCCYCLFPRNIIFWRLYHVFSFIFWCPLYFKEFNRNCYQSLFGFVWFDWIFFA